VATDAQQGATRATPDECISVYVARSGLIHSREIPVSFPFARSQSFARSLPPCLPASRFSLALSFASQADIKKVQAAAKLAKKHIEAGSNKLAHQLAKWTHGSKHAKASK